MEGADRSGAREVVLTEAGYQQGSRRRRSRRLGRVARLEDRVRDRALSYIRDGRDPGRWQHAADRRRRGQILAKLEAELTGPPRAAVKIRPPLRTTTPLRQGDIVSHRKADAGLVILRVVAVVGDDRDNNPIVGVADWTGPAVPTNAGALRARGPSELALPVQPSERRS